ncbi:MULTISPECIES: rod shape-determining protein RodA [Streptomyces]|uniref:peptidoglycan glycosyltransferase n=1 Tax=Streptomyces morookaense TaxID=1970 RepID=A0A7Y7B3L3_STRMO|nr:MULTISPECIES: rod shape-determining protein RodA [Streptomyces]MCC2278096.1 rod shape-determining protein RodA [Streptomyces sp. ET3-23]NVK77966.1 rod shape-determining protein RodA [Streptomyces morookaense]
MRTSLVHAQAAARRPALRAFGRASPLWRLDWVLLGAVVTLGTIGGLLTWSATMHREDVTGTDPHTYLKRHLLNLLIGLVLCLALSIVDYRRLRGYAPVFYGAALLFLATVLTPLASTINGAHSWIVIGGGFSLQPSEFVKLALVVMLAALLAEAKDAREAAAPGPRHMLAALALFGVPALVIMASHELGTSLVLAAVTAGILFAAGVPARYLAALGGVAATVVAAVFSLHLLSAYQLNRFAAFADPGLDPGGVGYNTHQARIAIGAGGLVGQGLFHGNQTNGGFVPEQQTDFIFTVAGEELGFLGAGAIIALVGVVLWRALVIARRAGDMFAMLLAVGVVCWLAFQSFENIGMTLGIMPVAGIPLPFVSYGGSSMFAVCGAVGLLQSIRIDSRRPRSG